jgi:diguanylate cyclase (GGDEF)-like protein
MVVRKTTGMVFTNWAGWPIERGERDDALWEQMLNIPTLWMVFVSNYLALGLIWAYVARSYPKFDAARFWAVASFAGATGAGLATTHIFFPDTLLPLFAGGTTMIFAACFGMMGIERFYDEPIRWRETALITASSAAALALFVYIYPNMGARILIYSLAQVVPFVLSLKLLFSSKDGHNSPGGRLAGIVSVTIISLYALRAAGFFAHFGGEFSAVRSSPLQSVLMLVLMFLSLAWNFGFLLMAIDRLRDEVADLALLDDLTGVGNRRHLLARLSEECARSERSGESFALLVIDLDGFKGINDTYGHAAGDACLQHFTLMAQTRLRPGDMLARTGGDEFCVVLPASTLREGAMIARRIIQVCREDAAECVGVEIPISVSIGAAQWTRDMGAFPDRLIAAADHALYDAKKNGRNCHAVYDPAPPPLAPDYQSILEQALEEQALRKTA